MEPYNGHRLSHQSYFSRLTRVAQRNITHRLYFSRRQMNRLDRAARATILHLLCEGNSIRAVTRLTGISKGTITKLVVDAGRACEAYQDRVLRNLTSKRVQVDEI